MRPFRILVILHCLAGASACSDLPFREDLIQHPTPDHFSVCYNNTCASVAEIRLEPHQWQGVRSVFTPRPAGPAEERARIAQAVARMENIVGSMIGASGDLGRNDGLGADGQMDCIDESTNTTVYLLLMKREELIRWHTVEGRATRGLFVFGWPHSTAVIREKASDKMFAVDSWFRANGRRPYVLPLDLWRDGWEPDGAGDHALEDQEPRRQLGSTLHP